VILYFQVKNEKLEIITGDVFLIRRIINMRKPRIEFFDEKLLLNFDTMIGSRKIKRDITVFHKEIRSIAIEYCKERVKFKEYQSERIVIRTNKINSPIIYYGIKEFNWYDNYKAGIRKFATDNNIKMKDEVLT